MLVIQCLPWSAVSQFAFQDMAFYSFVVFSMKPQKRDSWQCSVPAIPYESHGVWEKNVRIEPLYLFMLK